MVSYVDVLTILLIFFICAALKVPKAAAGAASIPPVTQHAVQVPPVAQREPPPAGPLAPDPPLADLQRRLEGEGIDVHREARGVVVTLPQAILFASGDDRISADARPIIEKIASRIRDLPNQVTLVGYADNIPVSNRRFRNNWELAAARGLRLLELLTREYGIAESRLSVTSGGANRPKDSNDTPVGRAANRRVEILIANE
jgi:chemotaxis protein MotB